MKFVFLFLLSSVFVAFTGMNTNSDKLGQSVVIGSHEPIVVAVGDDAILPCHLKPPIDVKKLPVRWKRDETFVHVCRNGKDHQLDQDQNFKNRTQLFYDEMIHGNISLKLTKVTKQDEGKYTCSVLGLHSQVRRGFIELIVGQSVVIGSHEPIVVAVGDDAILPCHLKPPIDVKKLPVRWKRDETFVHVCRNGKDHQLDQDQNFKNRTQLFYDEMIHGNISLKLTKVTKQDEGKYTCSVLGLHSQVRRGFIELIVGMNTSSDELEHRSCWSTAALIGKGGGIGAGAQAGIGVGCVALCVAGIGVLVYLLIRWRRNQQRTERTNRRTIVRVAEEPAKNGTDNQENNSLTHPRVDND